MTHLEVLAAIEAHGGRVTASFTLDSRGQTEGASHGRKLYACSGCHEIGHAITRCNGPGNPPKPNSDERRRKR